MVFGHIATVFFSGMPSDAAGPVADTMTPIFTCAAAPAATSERQAATSAAAAFFFMERSAHVRPSEAGIVESPFLGPWWPFMLFDGTTVATVPPRRVRTQRPWR